MADCLAKTEEKRKGLALLPVKTVYLYLYLACLAYVEKYLYIFIDLTGFLSKSRQFFTSFFERAALKRAALNLQKHGITDVYHVDSVIKNYLQFESRFIAENMWIRNNLTFKIINAFHCNDVEKLHDSLHKKGFVIVTPHTPALYMLVALINKLGHDASFVAMNPFLNPGKHISPFKKSILNLFSLWPEYQKFIFMENGSVFERCSTCLESGRSIIIAPDTPSDATQKVLVNFMGYQTHVAPGAALLSKKYQIPIIAIVPWAENIHARFRLNIKLINPNKSNIESIESTMSQIFIFFENCIKINPEFWQGWLYWHLMKHRKKLSKEHNSHSIFLGY